jgi:quercetin dioxygenase-like cupin family protein
MCVIAVVPAAFGQDIVKLAPDRAKVVLENAQVRVVRFTEGPGSKLPMHSHPTYVDIDLTGGKFRFTFPDGKTEEGDSKPGTVTFGNPLKHAAENLSKSRSEDVMIELKTKPAGISVPSGMDAAKLDPKHVTVEVDNEFVRVLRFKQEPHVKSPMHEHPAAVMVTLSGGETKYTFADGKTRNVVAKPGEVTFSGPVKHASENVGNKPAEVVVVELKTASR